MNESQRDLVERLYKELSVGNLGIFAGAGLSQEAGFVDWRELLRPIAKDLGLDVDEEVDLVALAQYSTTKHGNNRNLINQELVEKFSPLREPTENHKILARLPIDTYWTTNYDRLIERALEKSGRVPDAKYTVQQLPITKRKRDAVIYKMHGDVEHANEAVLTREDYERYHLDRAPFIDALKGDLVSKTLLFLGFSFTDPNLDYILSRVRVQYNNNRHLSDCILRRVLRDGGEPQEKFEYRQRKQKLFEKDLLRYGIRTTYVDDYAEITEILRALETRYRHKSVFVSGAAHEFGKISKDKSERFVFDLAMDLSRAEKRVLSGFGLGIGSAVIAGVVEATARDGQALDEDRLLVRPFPQSDPGKTPIVELWNTYRDDILKRAGIAIFVFGNKVSPGGEVVLSDGMREEYQLAVRHGVFPIPVGATGYMAHELWSDTMAAIEAGAIATSDEVKGLMAELGDSERSLDEIRAIVIKIVKLI